MEANIAKKKKEKKRKLKREAYKCVASLCVDRSVAFSVTGKSGKC